MKTRLFAYFGLVSLIIFSTNLSSFAASHQDHDHDHDHEDEVTELQETMDGIKRSFRMLRRQSGDPSKNASSLEYVATIRAGLVEALELVPMLHTETPEKEQKNFMAGYKKQLEKAIAALDDLETAFEEGRNEDAVALVGKVNDLRKSGHKKYQKLDEDE